MKGFGRTRRLQIGFTVMVTIAAAVGVWLLLNYVTTRPRLRATLDLSRGGRFSVDPATKAMIDELREREQVLEIDTYFLSSKDPRLRRVADLQRRVLALTGDLLRRLGYFGGDQLEITRHNVYEYVSSKRAEQMGLDAQGFNSIKLRLGTRERSLDLLLDLADIEIPPAERAYPGQMARPVLRDYKGEEAIASALRGLMREEDLVAYWLQGHLEAEFRDASGSGVNLLAREMRAHGFVNKPLSLGRRGRIPDDCKLLVIAGPEAALSAAESATIATWLENGGRALMLPHIVIDERTSEQITFNYLLRRVGIALSGKWLFNGVADPNDPKRMRFGDRECARIVIRGAGLNGQHPVTSRLKQHAGVVELHRARALEIRDRPDNVRAEYILTTNPKAWEVEVPRFGQPPNLAVGETAPRHVGVSLEFVPQEDGGQRGRLVVVSGMAFRNGGDALSFGRFAGSLFEANKFFAVYLVNWLVREESLVTVAAPRFESRTMTVAPPQIDRARTVLVWIVPGVFLFLSFFVVFWRRRA